MYSPVYFVGPIHVIVGLRETDVDAVGAEHENRTPRE